MDHEINHHRCGELDDGDVEEVGAVRNETEIGENAVKAEVAETNL